MALPLGYDGRAAHSCANPIESPSGAGRDKTGEALETLGTATNVETLVDCRLPSIITDDKVTCGIFTKALEKVSGPLVRSK